MAQFARAAGLPGVMYRDSKGNLMYVGPAPLPPISHLQVTPEVLGKLLKDVEAAPGIENLEDRVSALLDFVPWIPRLIAEIYWLNALRDHSSNTEALLLDRDSTLKAIARLDGVREMVELTLKEEATPEYQANLAAAAREGLGIQQFDPSAITGDDDVSEIMGEVSNDPQIEPAPREPSPKDLALKKVQDYIHANPTLVGQTLAQRDLFAILDEVEKLQPDAVFAYLDGVFKKETANV